MTGLEMAVELAEVSRRRTKISHKSAVCTLSHLEERGLVAGVVLEDVGGEDLEEEVVALDVDEDLVLDDVDVAGLGHVVPEQAVKVDVPGRRCLWR